MLSKCVMLGLIRVLLFSMALIVSLARLDGALARQNDIKKAPSSQYRLEPENINYCKTNSEKIQIHVRLKLRFNNSLPDRIFIYPLTKKHVSQTLIYRNEERLRANRPDTGIHISRYPGFLLKKPVEKMEAVDLYRFFTLLGPAASFEEIIEYTEELKPQEYTLLGEKEYYLRIFFEVFIPFEIEDLIKQQMKQLNPVIVGNLVSEPILIEIKEFNKLQPCG